MLLVFAIVGMQLYMGEFRQRCYDPLSRTFPEPDGVLCLPEGLGGRSCGDGLNTTKRDLARLSKQRLPGKGQPNEGYVMLHQLVAVMRLQRSWRRHKGTVFGSKPKKGRRSSRGFCGSRSSRRRSSFSMSGGSQGELIGNVLGRWLNDQKPDDDGTGRRSSCRRSSQAQRGSSGEDARRSSLSSVCSLNLWRRSTTATDATDAKDATDATDAGEGGGRGGQGGWGGRFEVSAASALRRSCCTFAQVADSMRSPPERCRSSLGEPVRVEPPLPRQDLVEPYAADATDADNGAAAKSDAADAALPAEAHVSRPAESHANDGFTMSVLPKVRRPSGGSSSERCRSTTRPIEPASGRCGECGMRDGKR